MSFYLGVLTLAVLLPAVGLPGAPGVLYPSLGVELRPEWAALLVAFSSFVVARMISCCNS